MEGSDYQKDIVYPFSTQCEQRHPGNCLDSPERCYIYRGEGYKWRTCQYLGWGCHHYGEKGHFKMECPQLNTELPQRHRQQSQSHQQSITVNKPGRSTQSGVNSNRWRPRVQNKRDQGRVFHMTQEDVRAASDVVADMLQMNDYQMHVLFDSGATHSFI